MKAVYGPNFNAVDLLRENKGEAPDAVRTFPNALNHYSRSSGSASR
jgi:hypothetical protein